MGVDRSSFQIEIKSTADIAGIEKSIAGMTKMRDAAAEAGQSTILWDAAIDKAKGTLAAAQKPIEEAGKASEHAAIGHREAHQAIHLLGEASGGALGPVGELAHFLSNPFLLASSGAVLAVKMLIEQEEKERENTLKNIEASREQAELFKGAYAKSVSEAAEALSKWNIEHAHARDNIDSLSEAMKRNITVAQEQLKNTNDLISAQLALNEARIHASGADPLTQDAMVQAARQRAQKARDAAEDAEKNQEIRDKQNRLNTANQESSDAHSALGGLLPKDQLANQNLLTAQGLLKANQDKLAAAQTAAEKADLESSEIDKAVRERQSHGQDVGFLLGNRKQNADEAKGLADAALKQIQDQIAIQTGKVAQFQVEKDAIDADIASRREIIKSRDELAKTLAQEVKQAQEDLAAHQASRSQVEGTQRQTEMVEHLSALAAAVQGGSANPQQTAEFGEANAHGTINQLWRDINQRITQFTSDRRLGTVAAGEQADTMGRIMGLIDWIMMHPAIANHDELLRRLQNAESRIGGGGYPGGQ